MSATKFISRLFILVAIINSLAVARAQTPVTNGLSLWVKADAGVTTNSSGLVTQWDDQSGNGLNAVPLDEGRSPKLISNAVNNKPAIRFDGTDDYLDVPSADPINIVGDIATFAVIRIDDYLNYNAIWGKTAGAGGNIPAPTDFYLSQGSGIPQVFRGDGSSFGNVAGTRPVRANNYVVIGFQQEGTTLTHFLNGQTNGVGQIPDTVFPADGGTNLKIGSREDLVTKMKGDIAEILIYNQALSEADRNATINYLRNKYNILNSLPIVSITSPSNNASSNAPANVTVTVNAVDDDGSIARVELFANGSLIGTATAGPYSFPLTVETPGTVTLTAVATDDKDGSTTSSPIVLNVTGTTDVPPLQSSSHLKLWLRGDSGITTGTSGGVVRWADQSGNDNDALLVEPDEAFAPAVSTLNAKPSVLFDGVDDYLEVADSDSLSITNDIASFFVVRFDDFATYRAVWGKTAGDAGNLPRPTDYYLLPGSGIPRVYRGGEAGNQSVDGRSVSTNTPVLLGFQQQGQTMTQYANGSPSGSGQITLQAQDDDTALKIGTRADFVTKMKGDIAELLIYDAALDGNGLANVRQYLGKKYGLTILFPANTAPAIQLSGATSGASYAAPTNLTLTATAADADGSIVRVDFFANGTRIGTATNAPYTATLELRVSGQVTLTATALDNLGATTSTPAIAVTVTGTPTPPIPSTGLVLWLKGDAGLQTFDGLGRVAIWDDQSGNFNHARQDNVGNRPVASQNEFGPAPVVRFDGADDFLEIESSPSLAITGDITSFFVVKIDDYDGFRTVWAKTAGNVPAPWDYWMAGNDGRPNLLHGNGGGVVGSFTADAPLPTDRYVIAGFDRADSAVNHYLDQALNGTGSINGIGADAGTPLLIGTRGDFFTKLKGALAELVIYNRALTEQERTDLQTYLQNKWFNQTPAGPSLTAVRGSGNTLVISWAAGGSFDLESSPQLGTGANWTKVTEPVVPSGGQNTVTVTTTDSARFFRLKTP